MELTILLFQENNSWVAQCLEYDIAAQGKTSDDALCELHRLYYGQVAIRRELKLPPLQEELQPAPLIYWQQCKKIRIRV